MLPEISQLQSIFKTEQPIQCITSYNEYENVVWAQERVTTIIAHNYIATIWTKYGTDKAWLGRWCWMSMKEKHGRTARFVSAYQPYCTSKQSCASVYAQYRRYFRQQGDNTLIIHPTPAEKTSRMVVNRRPVDGINWCKWKSDKREN